MQSFKYLLIGGGLSSAVAAKTIRQADPQATIAIACGESHQPYHRPPLTKEFMQGKKPETQIYVEAQDFWHQNKVDLFLGQSVSRLDMQRKVATLSAGGTIEFDKVLLATGGRPRRLDIVGDDLHGAHYFRTLNDAIGVSSQASQGRRAVILGGGFIGMELASSLTQRGLFVSLIERSGQVWSKFLDPELAAWFQSLCEDRGVQFYMNRTIREIEGEAQVTGVVLDDGQSLPADLVVIASGIELNTELARQAGLKMEDGAVIVDEHMQTSNPDIYAAGDIAKFPDPYFGYMRRVEHWGQAEYTGDLAGSNMAGQAKEYNLLTYIWSDIFDVHLEFAGDERQRDQTIIRGKMSDPAFAMLYLKGGKMTAYYSINLKRKEYQPLGKLIEQKVDLQGKENILKDPTADLTTLLAVPAGAK